MKTTLPGTVPSRRWQPSSRTRLSVDSKVPQKTAIEPCEAGPRGETPAIIVTAPSLQRSNLLFFLRSITESPRHK
jgi:hypothetical protein